VTRQPITTAIFVLVPVLLIIGGVFNVLAAEGKPLRLSVAIVLLVLALLFLVYGLVHVHRERKRRG
jgi:hypothetical protein